MDKKQKIGMQIKKARVEAGLTQVELAKKIGFSNVLVHEWETNKKEPRATTLLQLSKILNYTFTLDEE